jgi:hypothetical protein
MNYHNYSAITTSNYFCDIVMGQYLNYIMAFIIMLNVFFSVDTGMVTTLEYDKNIYIKKKNKQKLKVRFNRDYSH